MSIPFQQRRIWSAQAIFNLFVIMGVVLIGSAEPPLAQSGTHALKPTDDPCATRQKYLKVQAAADAADSAYKGITEPDWGKLSIPPTLEARYNPDTSGSDREIRLEGFLSELKSTLASDSKDTAGLTLEQAKANANEAVEQSQNVQQQWQQKQAALQAAQATVTQLQGELNAMGNGTTDAQKAKTIKEYEQVMKDRETQIKTILDLNDDKNPGIMDTARYEIRDPKHKDFNTPQIEQKKKALDAVLRSPTTTTDDIRKAEADLQVAVEQARAQAKSLMATYNSAEEQWRKLGGEDAQESVQNKSQKAQELAQAQVKLKSLQAQHPTQKDVTAADQLALKAQADILKLQQVRSLQTLLPQVEPWVKARLQRNEADKELETAKDEYNVAVQAENKALANAQAKLQNEQERMGRVQNSLQGQPKDEAYYQKLSQMTIHARATYELILLSLADFDCYPETRDFMDGLKTRMAKLDATRDKILQQAEAFSKPKPPVVIAKNPPVKKPTVSKPSAALWVCDGPIIEKSTRFTTTATNSTFQFRYSVNDAIGQGEIHWSGVPLSVREGDTVTLTMSATSTLAASAMGWFNLNCYDRPKQVGPDWDLNCASIPSNDNDTPTTSVRMVFKFTPGYDDPYIQAVVGMNEGYTSTVMWKYHKK